ncbi:MAG: DUF1456 family protein [Turicibacter sp.]|nr:DUF1456 family protein [Turicibacter sp.]
MTNNDLLVRLRYALDIKDTDMVEMFRRGGADMDKEGLRRILAKPLVIGDVDGEEEESSEYQPCNDKLLEKFLNGFIAFKRGPQDPKPGQPQPTKKDKTNNLFFKKVKVALSLTTDDLMEIFALGGASVSKGELGAILRKPDHRNYQECLDSFLRKFLKGLTQKHRG